METRKQIVFVWNYLNWGGAQVYFLAVMKLAREDWDILVLLPVGSSPEFLGYLEDLGVKYEFLEHSLDTSPAGSLAAKIRRQKNRILSEIEIFKRLRSIDRRNSVVHIEVAPWQSWQLLGLLAALRRNVFVTIHNYLPGGSSVRRTIWKFRLRFVSRLPRFHVFASNNDAKERFRGWFLDKFHETIPVTYTCVDPAQIDQAMSTGQSLVRHQFSIPADKFVVLCVGQFIDRKGRWVFLEAAKMALDIDPDLYFVWLMPQLPEKEDKARIRSYGLGRNFEPILSSSVGKSRVDVLSFFKVADVFALPSYVEGLPIALLEAMALGIPSISTNVFAIPEAIKHGETGLLVEAGNASKLKDSILDLKNDPAMRAGLSERGRQYVLDHFDERVAAGKIIAAYEESIRNG